MREREREKIDLPWIGADVLLTSTFAIRLPTRHQDPVRELTQCVQQCQGQHQHQRQQQQGSSSQRCIQECVQDFQQRQHGGRSQWELVDVMINPRRDDPVRQLQQCQQDCKRHGQDRDCQRDCVEEFLQDIQRSRHSIDEVDDDSENQGRQTYRECQQRCQRERGSQQYECQRRCQSDSRRGDRYDVEEELDNPYHRDQQQHRQCQQMCQRQGRGFECQRRCVEQIRRQQERGQHGGRQYEDEEEYMNPRHHDPQQQYRECQQRCQRQGQGYECQQRCVEQIRRQQERGQHGGRRQYEDELDDMNPRHHDPQQRYRECQQRCQRQGQGYECQQRCVEQIRRQQERGQHGGRRQYEDELDDMNPRHHDPQQRYRECQQRCQRQGQGYECQQRCVEQIRRQQERGQHGGRRQYEDELDDMTRHHDPQQRYRECQQRCQRQGQGYECQQRCQQEIRRQQERGQHGGRQYEQEMEDENPRHHDPQQRYRECQQRCQRQGQGYECQQRCQRELRERHPVLAAFMEVTGLF
ncbi:vicilin Car i 2.0101-like [Spinacia oleracea]|uniref:Vicilin Car i 2.0101-like n=1 Tax=Spinacia oleracea TaxID=3562 RepID=A0A9R0J3A3_SPIOL|nr:vicilin Car i 2.0101-like [Spinacia oleracea]